MYSAGRAFWYRQRKTRAGRKSVALTIIWGLSWRHCIKVYGNETQNNWLLIQVDNPKHPRRLGWRHGGFVEPKNPWVFRSFQGPICDVRCRNPHHDHGTLVGIAVVSKDELSPLRVLDSWAILPGSYNCHSSLRSARSARSARSVQTRATSATSLLSFSKDFRGGGQKQVYLEVMETVKLECSESYHLHDIRFFLCLLLLSQNFLPSRLWSHLAWTESLFFSWSLVP